MDKLVVQRLSSTPWPASSLCRGNVSGSHFHSRLFERATLCQAVLSDQKWGKEEVRVRTQSCVDGVDSFLGRHRL